MSLTAEQRWYYRHMGYSYPSELAGRPQAIRRKREKQARETVKAMAHAEAQGWTWEWHDDSESFDPHDCDGGAPHCGWCPPGAEPPCPGHDCEGCVLRDADGNQLGSLWNIVDANDTYRRVVEAELACEAYYQHVTKPHDAEAFERRYFAL